MNTSSQPAILLIGVGVQTADCVARALRGDYAMHTFDDAATAIDEVAAGHRADLILLNIKGADAEHFRVCQALSQHPATRHLPLLLLLDETTRLEIDAAFAHGARDYVTLPLRAGALHDRVQTCLAAADAVPRRLQLLVGAMAIDDSRERQRLAAMLHDGPTQDLAAACMYLAATQQAATGAEPEMLEKVTTLIKQSLQELRKIMFELSPPNLFANGLPSALNWLADRHLEKSGQSCTISLPDDFPPVAELQVVRLFQVTHALLLHARNGQRREALNIRVDGGAEQVRVVLRHADGAAPTDARWCQLHDRVALFGGHLTSNGADPSILQVALTLR